MSYNWKNDRYGRGDFSGAMHGLMPVNGNQCNVWLSYILPTAITIISLVYIVLA